VERLKLESKGQVHVLEIGCGTAIDSYCTVERTKVDAWAIDISDKAIEVAERIGKHFNSKITLMISDITRTAFKDGFFNLIFSQGVVEHFRDPLQVIKEQSRLLQDGGYLIIDVPQKYNVYSIYRKLLIMINRWPYGWERGYSIFELRRLGKLAGLQEIEAFGRGLTSELSKSKQFHIAAFGMVYNFVMKRFSRIFYKFSVFFLQDITVVYLKKRGIPKDE
jgi:ubiquinone/menaquinone biosynthesis C-methylase UbiE